MHKKVHSLDIISEEAGSDVLPGSSRQHHDFESDENQQSDSKNAKTNMMIEIDEMDSNSSPGPRANRDDRRASFTYIESTMPDVDGTSDNASLGQLRSSMLVKSLNQNHLTVNEQLDAIAGHEMHQSDLNSHLDESRSRGQYL